MDEVDKAHQYEEAHRLAALAKKRKNNIPATGYCLFCNELLKPGFRWCDTDCRDDWEREQDGE